jgi:hypothetical protein
MDWTVEHTTISMEVVNCSNPKIDIGDDLGKYTPVDEIEKDIVGTTYDTDRNKLTRTEGLSNQQLLLFLKELSVGISKIWAYEDFNKKIKYRMDLIFPTDTMDFSGRYLIGSDVGKFVNRYPEYNCRHESVGGQIKTLYEQKNGTWLPYLIAPVKHLKYREIYPFREKDFLMLRISPIREGSLAVTELDGKIHKNTITLYGVAHFSLSQNTIYQPNSYGSGIYSSLPNFPQPNQGYNLMEAKILTRIFAHELFSHLFPGTSHLIIPSSPDHEIWKKAVAEKDLWMKNKKKEEIWDDKPYNRYFFNPYNKDFVLTEDQKKYQNIWKARHIVTHTPETQEPPLPSEIELNKEIDIITNATFLMTSTSDIWKTRRALLETKPILLPVDEITYLTLERREKIVGNLKNK